MKKLLGLILIFSILSINSDAKNQTFDDFIKNLQKTKGDAKLLSDHCIDYLQDGDFKIAKEEFLSDQIAMNTLGKFLSKLTKTGNKYSARIKESTKTLKDNSFAETTFYKYGAGTNYSSESNFYVLRIECKISTLEDNQWKDNNYNVEYCFALRGGFFKIVGYSYIQ